MIRNLLVVTALAAAGVAVGAAPASAACVGTDNTIVVCADPTGAVYYRDCVHTGTGPCTPVEVPGPTASCDKGPLLDVIDVVGGPFAISTVDCDL